MSHYQLGDWVVPTDLPRAHLCRIVRADRLARRAGGGQILHVVPTDGPWPPGTELVRLDDAVRPAGPRELWQVAARPAPSRRRPRVRRRLVLAQTAA